MQLTFLQADKPLTKKYTKRADGGYDSESYPMLFRVTSHVEDVATIDDFAAALKKHAELGHCLHTGSLDRPLENESRKGHHDKDEQRSWVVLDLDGLKSFNGVDEFLAEMPESFQQTSYIVQESPSSGIKPGLRAHVFFMLDRAEHMKDVKTWVMHTNLVTEKLRDEITLTAKDFALSYPLDRIANDNGRVVYITPPECVGFEDPVKDRIRIVRRDQDKLRCDFRGNVADVKKAERDHVDKLRSDKGLPKSRVKEYYEERNGLEVLKRSITTPGRVHPVREDSSIIMRCNLDDGDSEAYFYYIEFPKLLRNHKGEPNLYMEAVDPEYYSKVAMPEAKKRWEKDNQAFVFRNELDDKWYAGVRRGEEITRQPNQIGSETKIEDYFLQHSPHVPVPDPIPTWEMKFDPSLDTQWNEDSHIFNTWRKTDIMANAQYRSKPPIVVDKIIRHVVGGGEEEYERFINWLAYIYQKRQKTGTAWIFHGVQGTGKGLLVDYIITPILGHDYVAKQQARNLRAEFNSFLETALVVNLDEFDLFDAGHESTAVMQALKMWITDKRLPIRKMHTNSIQVDNFSNFVITTNSQNAMPIPPGERRFSFGLRQEKKLEISHDEVDEIQNELIHFAGYLSGYEVNTHMAHTAHENEAKRRAEELSKNSIEEFAASVTLGDLRYFIELAHEPVSGQDGYSLLGTYKQYLSKWVGDAKAGRESAVSVDEMLVAYSLATGDTKKTTAKFKKLMAHKQAEARRTTKLGNGKPYGWIINWDLSEEDKVNIGAHIVPVNSTPEPTKDQLQAPVGPPNMES